VPAARLRHEEFFVAVDDADLRVGVQNSNSLVDPTRAKVVGGVQRKDILPLGSEDLSVSRRGHTLVFLPYVPDSLCAQCIHLFAYSFVRG
jgi:hypothetical protein